MITRAQAEALLTLAESLEACERLGVSFPLPSNAACISFGDSWQNIYDFSAMEIRLAVNTLIPKSET